MVPWGKTVRELTFPPESVRWAFLESFISGTPIQATARWGVGLDQCPVDGPHHCTWGEE